MIQNISRRRRFRLETLEQRRMLVADGVVANDDQFQVEQNHPAIELNVIANDVFDSDYAGPKRITSVSTGSLGGRIEIIEEKLRYTPPANEIGKEYFEYTIDQRDAAEVSVEIISPLQSFETEIGLIEDEYVFNLLDGSRFAEDYEGKRELTLISESAFGAELELTEDRRSVRYRPNLLRGGKDQFTFIVDDVYVATASIDINLPLSSDRFEIIERSGTTRLEVLSNDFEHPIHRHLAATSRITHVISQSDSFDVSIDDDGKSLIVSTRNDVDLTHSAYESFRYVVDGRYESVITLTIQHPMRDDYVIADVDGDLHTYDVLENDTYYSIFGGAIRIVDRVTSVNQSEHGGTVKISDDGKQILYTPAEGFSGSDSFQYVANEKYRATVVVDVNAPVRDDATVAYPKTINRIDVLENDFLSDQRTEISVESVSVSDLGVAVTIAEDGSLLYRPPTDIDLSDDRHVYDTFTYTNSRQETASVHVSIVMPTTPDSFEVDAPHEMALDVLSNDQFVEGYEGAGTITAVSSPIDGGVVSIADDGRSLKYFPASDTETFTYTVDGQFTETIHFYSVNRLAADRSVADQNGDAILLDVLANDFQNDASHRRGPYQGDRLLTSVGESEHGATVFVRDDGKVSYTPAAEFVGTDTFSYKVDDFLSSTATVHVIRRTADDVVRVAPGSIQEELRVRVNDILGADYRGPARITDITQSDIGSLLTISDSGEAILYTPPDGFEGEEEIVYTIDGKSKATVRILVRKEQTPVLPRFENTSSFQDNLLRLSIERYQSQFGEPTYSIAYDEFSDFRDQNGVVSKSSETNVQIAGVDEDDIVETDGSFIYSLRGKVLEIVAVDGEGGLESVSQTHFDEVPVGMYLAGDRLTVIAQTVEQGIYPEVDFVRRALIDTVDGWRYPQERVSETIVTVLNVTDRSNPLFVQQTRFDGDFRDSRRVGNQVFFVLQSNDVLPSLDTVCEEDDQCRYETEEEFIARFNDNAATLIESSLPSYSSFDGGGEFVRGGPLFVPEDVFVADSDSTHIVMVAAIDMSSGEPGLSSISGITTSAQNEIFATTESVYVFDPRRESLENEIWTDILKFNWDAETGAIDFAARGSIPGRVLNQFSADEKDGFLRVTTQVSNSFAGNFSGQDETAVFVLEDDAGALEPVGGLQNLAIGHQVKSVRYFGDSVFITTFQTSDPLHVVDLSNVRSPVVLGSLPLPGFSNYMQLISADRLLTVGTNTATGFGGRAMVTLFDVSDLSKPRIIEQFNLPKFSTSEANVDHHAFGWFAPNDSLAVPTSRSYFVRVDADEDGYAETDQHVREDTLSILHVGLKEDGKEGISSQVVIEHEAAVLRSVFVDDFAYSVGLDAIRSVNVNQPNGIVDEIVFAEEVATKKIDTVTQFDDRAMVAAARQQFAKSKKIPVGSVSLVTSQRSGSDVNIVLRAADSQVRYEASHAEDVVMADDSFEFIDRWHNETNPLDTNGDSVVTARDALLVINELDLRRNGDTRVHSVVREVTTSKRYVDANNDGRLTALDALIVINSLEFQPTSIDSTDLSKAEGEQGTMMVARRDFANHRCGLTQVDKREEQAVLF